MIRIIRTAPLLILTTLVGCQTIWNIANRSYASESISDAYRKYGVVVSDISCSMIGTTREFECVHSLSSSELSKLILGLEMYPVKPGVILNHGGCSSLSSRATSKTYQTIIGIPGLNYFYLHHDNSTSETCLQGSYSYG
jgi:hypothetical protein